MADNGKRIAASKTVACKRCGCVNLAWTQNKAGKWYLCETYPSQSEMTDARWMATWVPHNCAKSLELAKSWDAKELADRRIIERANALLGPDPLDER
jgi:hypothetical protein